MKILEQALNKINPIHKKQKDFLIILIQGLIGSVGKKTFRNLARYMQIAEHTFLRQMTKTFNFIGLNKALIEAIKNDNEILIAAQDASFIPKSGKATHGLDFFWNGCASKAEKGLEVDVIAAIKISADKKEGYTLSAEQSPANPTPKSERKKKKEPTEQTKIDFCLNHLKKNIKQYLCSWHKAYSCRCISCKNVNGAVECRLHVISKFRKDARLARLYTGPQKKWGRKKKMDNSRINPQDFQNAKVVSCDDGNIELRSCLAYSISLKREVKVVWVQKKLGNNKYAEAFLFSTDLALESLQIYQFYTARFQIEFHLSRCQRFYWPY